MKWILMFILATVVAPVTAYAEEPVIGDIFDPQWDSELPVTFRSWTVIGKSSTSIPWGATVFVDDLRTPHRYLIAVTEPVKGDIGKILKLISVTPQQGEIRPAVCSFADLATPILALLNQKNEIARGFFLVGKEVIERRWFIDAESLECYDEPE